MAKAMALPKSVVSVRLSMTGNTAILEDRDSPQSRALLPTGCKGCSLPRMCPPLAPGASSPAVESCFLPGPQPVSPGGHGVGELDELAAERGLTQEQDEGVESPERANQS